MLKNLILCNFEVNSCNYDDFEIFEDSNSMICYRFNAFNESKIRRNATITVMADSFVTAFNLSMFTNINKHFDSRMMVLVNNASTKFRYTRPYYMVTGNFLESGVNSIKIEREFIQRLSEPYNQCVKQDTTDYISDYFQHFIKNNKTYQQKYCFDMCVAENIKSLCNCKETVRELDSYLACFQNQNLSDCALNLAFGYRRKTLNLPKECSSSCPEECDSINYRTYQSSLGSVNMIFFNSSQSQLKNIALVYVYYPSLDYTLIDQSRKMNTFDLVSSVGGLLGLFTGLSFFTMVEILEIVFELVSSNFIRKLTVNTISVSTVRNRVLSNRELQSTVKK